MSKYRPGRILQRVFRIRFPSRLYDQNLGWLLGGRFCRLTHVGRKSGKRYRTVLEVVGTDDTTGEVMVISGYGAKADWYRNLHANGTAEIETGRRQFVASARDLDVDEAERVFVAYERSYRFMKPLLRRLLTKLAGWDYDGSDEARRKLASQLPIVAFTPSAPDRG